jgi:radical SAM protein with 4Fe4S-binding SPASM domain
MPFRVPLRVRIRRSALSGAHVKESAAPERAGPTIKDLSWINEFYRGMKPHLFTREEDGVVILPPNRVYKANAAGITLLKHLEKKGRISGFPGLRDGERARQVNDFFSDLRDFCAGAAGNADNGKNLDALASVEKIPYSFSYTTLPILGEIAVTYRCNNSCLFCYAACTAGAVCGAARTAGSGGLKNAGRAASVANEMSLRRIKKIIRIFKSEARIPFFSFTGGEPLLRADLEAMISYAVKLGLRVNLITNATLVDASRARSLFKSGLRTAQVSLESNHPSLHDRLTKKPGSFEKTLAGIKNLKDAGISVQTNTTITALNAESASRMPAFLNGLGVGRFAMNLYIPMGGEAEEALFFPYSKIGPVIEAVRSAARSEGMTFYWYSPVPHCIYNPIAKGLGNKSCAAMDGLLSVSPAGEVLPCSSYMEPMGNLLEESFRDIWFSKRAKFFKEKRYSPVQCAGCVGFSACQSACPIYWAHRGTEEIENPSVRRTSREEVSACR